MVSVHTSPLEQPGTGDAGGMNVYVAEVAKQLAARGVEVDIFTRATTGAVPPIVDMVPGVSVRHITAGPYEGLSKADLPGQLCAFTAGVMRAAAARPEGWYDVLHSHYWLSGQVGWLAADRWGVPLVHTMHTMARVKNLYLADRRQPRARRAVRSARRRSSRPPTGSSPTPRGRPRSSSSSMTPIPARSASSLPESTSRPSRPATGTRPGGASASRLPRGSCSSSAASSRSSGPTCCCASAPSCCAGTPSWRDDDGLTLAVLGGPSGSGLARSGHLEALAAELGVEAQTRFVPPVSRPELTQWYRAADLVIVPSHSESFGLVALEAEACGTPVVAADVGGLPIVVGDTGLLVEGHDIGAWTDAVESLLVDPERRRDLGRRAAAHAQEFGWGATTDHLLEVYAEARRVRTPTPLDPFDEVVQAPAALIP